MRRKLTFLTTFIIIFTLGFADGIYLKDTKSWTKMFNSEKTVDYPVIFIHGIAGGLFYWDDTAKKVSNDNYYDMRYYLKDKIYHNYISGEPEQWIFNVSYYTLNPVKETISGDLTEYAKRLEKIINNIKLITKKEKVILIAHSMGGLVARKYAVMSDENWNSVYKIVTVGTPNKGVKTSFGIVGQLEDLADESEFLIKLNKEWEQKRGPGTKWEKWGVVGAVESKLWMNLNNITEFATDLAGVGYIEISSAIPFGEWKEAFKNVGSQSRNTDHFGFRIMVEDNHIGLLKNIGTLKAIEWAVER